MADEIETSIVANPPLGSNVELSNKGKSPPNELSETDVVIEDEEVSQEELAFGFDPTRLVDDIYNVVDDFISDASDTTEEHLRKEMRIRSWDTERVEVLERGADNLLLKLRNSVDQNFDKFELYVLRNIFSIPEDLNLQAPLLEPCQSRFEELQSTQLFDEQMAQVDQELGQILKKLKQTMVRRNKYEIELRALEQRLEKVESTTSRINFEAVDPEKMKKLVETTDKLSLTVEKLTDLNNRVSKENHSSEGNSTQQDNMIARGQELQRDFKNLKESFGNPEVGLLQNLLEKL